MQVFQASCSSPAQVSIPDTHVQNKSQWQAVNWEVATRSCASFPPSAHLTPDPAAPPSLPAFIATQATFLWAKSTPPLKTLPQKGQPMSVCSGSYLLFFPLPQHLLALLICTQFLFGKPFYPAVFAAWAGLEAPPPTPWQLHDPGVSQRVSSP